MYKVTISHQHLRAHSKVGAVLLTAVMLASVTPILADERDATICSAVHRDSRSGRNGGSTQLTETGPLIVPATFTVVAPTLGAIRALRGGYRGEQKQ